MRATTSTPTARSCARRPTCGWGSRPTSSRARRTGWPACWRRGTGTTWSGRSISCATARWTRRGTGTCGRGAARAGWSRSDERSEAERLRRAGGPASPSSAPTGGRRKVTLVGIGYDVHPFAAGRRLVLGGVELEHDHGLAGHSDADVLTHAIIDALLGAAGQGDIGQRFPDTDPAWKDADSLELLRTAVAELREG